MNKMKCFLSKKMLLAVVVLLSVGYVQAQEAKDIVLLTLDKALEIALSENPTMKVAGQEIQLKKEAKKEAYGGLFPEVSLTGSYSRTLKKQTMVMDFGGESQTIQVGSDNSYNGGLNVSLPVFAPTLYKSINLLFIRLSAVKKKRQGQIFLNSQNRYKIIKLINKAYLPAAENCKCRFIKI